MFAEFRKKKKNGAILSPQGTTSLLPARASRASRCTSSRRSHATAAPSCPCSSPPAAGSGPPRARARGISFARWRESRGCRGRAAPPGSPDARHMAQEKTRKNKEQDRSKNKEEKGRGGRWGGGGEFTAERGRNLRPGTMENIFRHPDRKRSAK